MQQRVDAYSGTDFFPALPVKGRAQGLAQVLRAAWQGKLLPAIFILLSNQQDSAIPYNHGTHCIAYMGVEIMQKYLPIIPYIEGSVVISEIISVS